MSPLPLKARLFIVVVALAAVPLPLLAATVGYHSFSNVDLLGLALLLVISDSIGSRGSRDAASIALGSVAAMAALPLLGALGSDRPGLRECVGQRLPVRGQARLQHLSAHPGRRAHLRSPSRSSVAPRSPPTAFRS